MMRFRAFSLAVLLASSPNVRAARPSPADLDENGIHASYTDGDFETVIARIDAFTRAHPSYSKEDSVFIAKHLAVIYAANPATREKGKLYMFRLLELLPSAKIVDMFVSDEIDRIFEHVREEFLVRQRNLGKDPMVYAASDSAATPASGRSAAAKSASRSHTVYWWMGGTALLAATGAATYFLVTDMHAGPKDKVYDIPH